ncbi:hypothetical protein DL768_005838 [Monosporascus sp. mg162]|nr:hypothetical protein DL768_005838 [Monosporascus sp. mg162]
MVLILGSLLPTAPSGYALTPLARTLLKKASTEDGSLRSSVFYDVLGEDFAARNVGGVKVALDALAGAGVSEAAITELDIAGTASDDY